MTKDKEICILIPTLNPSEQLLNYLDELITAGFIKIIIVNDGSDSYSKQIFNAIEDLNNSNDVIDIVILCHAVNLGKGRALKNGFNYYLVHLSDQYAMCKGIITVDSDGQHLVDDVSKIDYLLENGASDVILGCRDFSLGCVPMKSKFGNQVTKVIIRWLFGKKLSDTQTGLRGFSNKILEKIVVLNGERFEYEMNVLIECIKKKIPIEEVTIHTVYEDDNSGSHFRPLFDSYKIYSLILKQFFSYILVSLSSFVLDCTLFWILCKLFSGSVITSGSIWMATAGARCMSSLFNYFMNKFIVFEYKEKEMRTLIQYFLLCVAVMIVSASGVSALYMQFHTNEVLIKCVVDTLLFFVSYFVQNRLIFVKR